MTETSIYSDIRHEDVKLSFNYFHGNTVHNSNTLLAPKKRLSLNYFDGSVEMQRLVVQKKILIIDDEYFNIVALENLIKIHSSAPIDHALNGGTAMEIMTSNC
jgi:hypothetical protein